MKNVMHAALAAATLALAAPAFAGPGYGDDGADKTPTTGQTGQTDPNDQRAGSQQQPRSGDTADADDDLGLKGELNLDDATAKRVRDIVSSAKDQHHTLKQQMKTALDDLRRAREGNDPQAVKTALDRLRGLHGRMNDLEEETVDRVFANLSLQQQADFALWMADKKHDQLISEDQS